MPNLLAIVIPVSIMFIIFSFTSFAVWAGERTKERQAFYRSELLKKLAESPGEQAQQILAILREEEQDAERRRREGRKLGGLILSAVGVGLAVMLALTSSHSGAWAVGLVPLLMGLALLFYSFVLAPRASA